MNRPGPSKPHCFLGGDSGNFTPFWVEIEGFSLGIGLEDADGGEGGEGLILAQTVL